jgi:hypothetical protein
MQSPASSKPLRVLVGCEFSGVVRDAFIRQGCDAWSCDLLPCERPGPHIQGDVLTTVRKGTWDLFIVHPECRYLNHAGVRWLYRGGRRWNADGTENPRDPERWRKMEEAAAFFLACLNAHDRVAAENSEMHPHALALVGRKADQVIQPWQFGHGEVKATHLWLRGLPTLQPTRIVSGRVPRVHYASPGPERWKERSRTLTGIAEAMAAQWSNLR